MTVSAPRRSTRARPTDDELLDAARSVFLQNGYLGASMQAIAQRADSTKPTLYAHFGDKSALYTRLLEREADTFRQWLFAAYDANAELELAAQVAADTAAYFDYAAAEPAGFQLLMGEDPTSSAHNVAEALMADVRRQLEDRIRAYLRRHDLPTTLDVGQLAAILTAVPVSTARHALDNDGDLRGAAALATAFSVAALTGLTGRHS